MNAQFNSTNFPGLITTGASTPDLNNLRSLYAMLTGRLDGISGQNNLDTASKQYKTLGALVELDAQSVGDFYAQFLPIIQKNTKSWFARGSASGQSPRTDLG